MRTACGGTVANLIDAVVESEGDEWDFEAIPGRTGDASIDVVWNAWIAEATAVGAVADSAELSDDDGEPYAEHVGGSGDFQPSDWDESDTADWGVRVGGTPEGPEAGC